MTARCLPALALALFLAAAATHARDVGAAPAGPPVRDGARATRPIGHAERVDHHDLGRPPTRGPSAAEVTIEVYFVPGPGMPSAALRLLQQLQERHASRAQLVYRVLKSGSAFQIPSAALEAHAQGRFFEFLDELARVRGVLKRDELLDLARRAGVDPDRVAAAAKLDHHREALEANQRRLERLHGSGVPSLMFNALPAKLSLATVTLADLERTYEAAYARALDKLDRGYAPQDLADAFDREALRDAAAAPVPGGELPAGDPLAVPPLALDELPSAGAGPDAAVSIAVLCRPNDPECSKLLRAIEAEIRLFPSEVRLVWAPWFEPARDDAAELTRLGDAALCAEAIGSSEGELISSPGWLWIKESFAQSSRAAGRRLTAEPMIDVVAGKLGLDGRALAGCRARRAGATLRWIEDARRAGVPRSNIAVVVGGRIYAGLVEQPVIHRLVEAELAPGILGSLPRWRSGRERQR